MFAETKRVPLCGTLQHRCAGHHAERLAGNRYPLPPPLPRSVIPLSPQREPPCGDSLR